MNSFVIGLVCSLIFGTVAYISTSNFIVTGVVAFMTIIYFAFFANKILSEYKKKIDRFHECYYFINNFVVTLSIKGSIRASLESVSNYCGQDYAKLIEGIKDLQDNDKIRYLQKYFKFHTYTLFVDLLSLYMEEGGDIIKMSNYLINQLRMTEEYIIKCNQMSKRKAFEFITLWTFSLVILVVLRFALSQFYKYLIKQLFYQIGIGVIFAFLLVTVHMLLLKISNVEIRGWNNEQ